MATKEKISEKSVLFTTSITREQFDELNRVRKSPFEFSKNIFVIHPRRGKVKFNLYPFQQKVLWHFLTERFNIILKFRQAGITELIAMFCLWYAMYHKHKNVQIISIKERTAKRVLRRIKYMYMNLPEHLKVPVVNGRGDDLGTSTELEFINGSIITSIPTTEEAGRSEAVSLLVIDEAAIVRWASTIWASAFPTLSTGGRAIVNSTPYGVGNFFHRTWVEAMSRSNGFNPIRLYWWMHPERDLAWYNDMSKALGPRRTAQEIDGDFLTSGHSVFDLVEIRAIEERISELQYKEVLMDGSLYVYRDAHPGERCFIGADIATGRSRDYSTFSIMTETGDELASCKVKMAPRRFAKLLAHWGYTYNRAMVAAESNDIGLSATESLQDMNYPNMYYSRKILRKKGQTRHDKELIPGWYTTGKTRPIIISGLEQDIRERNIDITSPFFCQEAYTFIYDNANRPVALNKNNTSKSEGEELMADDSYTDDSILGTSITNYIRKAKQYGPIIAAR